MAAVHKTLRGGPHHGLKLKLWEPLAPALRYLNFYVDANGVATYDPDATYVLRAKQQKSRTINVYEYVEDWKRECEDRNRNNRARRLAGLRRQILAMPI